MRVTSLTDADACSLSSRVRLQEWMFTRDGQMDQSGKAYSTFIESTPTTFKGLTLHNLQGVDLAQMRTQSS